MKAITLTQPWATLVAIGAKQIETRSWGTSHRGWLAIHAAKGWTMEDRELTLQAPFWQALEGLGYVNKGHGLELPTGVVLAVVNLHKVGRISLSHIHPGHVYIGGNYGVVEEPELSFGNYADGRYGWVFTNPHRLAEPVPARGMLGLWEWEPPAGVLPEGVR